jgi:hypothetical protein
MFAGGTHGCWTGAMRTTENIPQAKFVNSALGPGRSRPGHAGGMCFLAQYGESALLGCYASTWPKA